MSSKLDLINTLQKILGDEYNKTQTDKIVNAVLEAMKTQIKKTKVLQLIGFGTFKVVLRKSRMGVNPKTREKMKIKASKSVRFTPGKSLKTSL